MFFSVGPENEGTRLDVFVADKVPALSRRAVREAIAEGKIRLNGRRARKGLRVRQGEVVAVARELAQAQELGPNPALPVRVLFEDEFIVAVDKPAGIPSHALRPFETETVANFLIARYPEMRSLSRAGLEAGLVHRLDTDTSGVLLAARTAHVREQLRQQFRTGQVCKEYLALVLGAVAEPGAISEPLEHDPARPGRMRVARGGNGREAMTHYWPLERYTEYTLLRVTIYTGVLHQIRVHLAWAGHPIAGDADYGGTEIPLALKRQFLHAKRISLHHPVSGAPFSVESPLPDELAGVLQELRGYERQLYRAMHPRPSRRKQRNSIR
ncbi:MAG: putative RNA pseudouridine synthase [Candidatus Binatia bacterium]|nr:MAG: putative RNA pseudouridine synthase [Candidatus Binatia bacterium]